MASRRAASLFFHNARPIRSRMAHHAARLAALSTSGRRSLTVPAQAWDAHIHVAEPERFPPSSKAVYEVHTATLKEAHANAARLGVPNLAFVQTSTYGTDNAWILACLDEVGPAHGRGVVVFEPRSPDASPATLADWHARGVRGVRLNFTSVKQKVTGSELRTMLRTYADIVRPLGGWGIHLYMPLELVPALVPVVDELGVKVAIDHFGDPPSLETPMSQHRGWTELLEMLEDASNVFVKISAPYRFTKDTEFKALEPAARELLRARNGGAAVFASDWPHTRFEDTDIRPWVNRCLEWCDEDEKLATKLFRTNAEEFYDVHS